MLGRAVGVPYRIDLFAGERGAVLGEFTADPFGAGYHCAAPRTNGTGPRDACHLGRLWAESVRPDGGPSLRAPPAMADWRRLSRNTSAQCQLAMAYTRGG